MPSTVEVRAKFVDEASAGLNQFTKNLDSVGKTAARQGIAELTSQVPVLGSALGNAAGKLSGFTLALGGLVGIGAGALKWLQSMGEEATKTGQAIAELSAKIGTDFQATLLEVNRIRAQSSGDQTKAIELQAQKELAAAEATKNAKIAKAKEELDQLDLLGRKRTELSQKALTEIAAAEAEAANVILLTNTRKTADLIKLEQDRLDAAIKARDEEVKAAAEAAEKQKALLNDLRTTGLAVVKGLGADFADVAKSLQVGQFVQQAQSAVDLFKNAQAAGADETGRFTEVIAALQGQIQDATVNGILPAAAATDMLAKSTSAVKQETEQLVPTIMTAADAFLAEARAALQAEDAARRAGAARSGATGQATTTVGTVPAEGMRDSFEGFDFAHRDPYWNVQDNERGNPNAPSTRASSAGYRAQAPIDLTTLRGYANGGTVPGPRGAAQLAVVHGGEQITPAGSGGRPVVQIQAINVHGSPNDRDVRTTVELVAQEIEARFRRLYG